MPATPTPGFEAAAGLLRAALPRLPRSIVVSPAAPPWRAAAVLVPILDRPGGPTLLFTRRSSALPHHRGEISFPGGGLLAGEAPEAGALREAREEIGLEADAAGVEVLGRLDDYPSIARFVVTPVVAVVRSPPPEFAAADGEVDEAFEVPLARLLEAGVRREQLWDPALLPGPIAAVVKEAALAFEDVDPETGHWRVWSYDAGEARVVWGLTARILADLLDRAFGSSPLSPPRGERGRG